MLESKVLMFRVNVVGKVLWVKYLGLVGGSLAAKKWCCSLFLSASKQYFSFGFFCFSVEAKLTGINATHSAALSSDSSL